MSVYNSTTNNETFTLRSMAVPYYAELNGGTAILERRVSGTTDWKTFHEFLSDGHGGLQYCAGEFRVTCTGSAYVDVFTVGL